MLWRSPCAGINVVYAGSTAVKVHLLSDVIGHCVAADTAADLAAQGPVMLFPAVTLHKSPDHLLCPVKFFSRHNALMGSLHGDPVRTVHLDRVRAAHYIPHPLSENILPDIAFVPDNF